MIGRWLYAVFIGVAVIGAILLLIGGILVPIFKYDLHTSKQVGNTSFYFFNISNPDEIVKTGRNTTVNQVGPYVYRLTMELRRASFANGRRRLSYELYKKYTFDKDKSVGNETDEITTVNLPIVNLATRLRLLANETVERSVSNEIGRLKEGLFKGIQLSDLLWGYVNHNLANLTDFLKHEFGINPLVNTTYGLLFESGQKRGKTFEGTFEVSTEKDETFDRWNVREWNGKSHLDVWNSPKCNRINGTDGYAWPSGLNHPVTDSIFDSDWCRSIDLVIRGSESTGHLNTTRYEYDEDAFGYRGWRGGFCQPTPTSFCLRGGVLNVTKCKNNNPLLLSQPHFLNADWSYIHAIHGLNPDPKYHATYFKVDQASGEVLEGSRKLQLNAYVMKLASFPHHVNSNASVNGCMKLQSQLTIHWERSNMEDMKIREITNQAHRDTENFTNRATVIPIAWMEEVYSMTEKEKESLLSQRKFYDDVQYSLIGIGAVMLIFALLALIVVFLLNRRRPEGETQPLLGDG